MGSLMPASHAHAFEAPIQSAQGSSTGEMSTGYECPSWILDSDSVSASRVATATARAVACGGLVLDDGDSANWVHRQHSLTDEHIEKRTDLGLRRISLSCKCPAHSQCYYETLTSTDGPPLLCAQNADEPESLEPTLQFMTSWCYKTGRVEAIISLNDQQQTLSFISLHLRHISKPTITQHRSRNLTPLDINTFQAWLMLTVES
jgi:hypothetical protein